MGHYSEARSGSRRETRKVQKTCGSEWKTRKGSEGVREARKRSGRPWERVEEAGRLGKVTVRYTNKDQSLLVPLFKMDRLQPVPTIF